jgi:hypothetical protein
VVHVVTSTKALIGTKSAWTMNGTCGPRTVISELLSVRQLVAPLAASVNRQSERAAEPWAGEADQNNNGGRSMSDALRRVTAITLASEVAIGMARNPNVSDEDLAKEWQKRFFEVVAEGMVAAPLRPEPMTQGSENVSKDKQNSTEK